MSLQTAPTSNVRCWQNLPETTNAVEDRSADEVDVDDRFIVCRGGST